MKFCEIDLDFRCSKVGIMVVFPDLLCQLGILEAKKCEFSRLAFFVASNFAVSNLGGVAFKVFFDLFFSKVFGYVFDDDSTHGLG